MTDNNFGTDQFKLMYRESAIDHRWTMYTGAIEIVDVGCIVKVFTRDEIKMSETLTFVPGVKLVNVLDDDNNIVGRELHKW